jgi:hypothetical protein
VKCWFHLGPPKTGTTSIQETLYYELQDPGFVYCGFGDINGSYALSALVGHNNYFASLRAMPYGAGDGGRRRALRRLARCVDRARSRGADLILSAEWSYGWEKSKHVWFGELARDLGLDLHVVLYLRPPLDWIASLVAQYVRYGRGSTHEDLEREASSVETLQRRLRFSKRLELLGELYGSDRVTIRPYLREQLVGGCVVQDFCHVIGMRQPPSTIHRRNERMRLPTVQCLHQYNMFLGRPLRGPLELARRDALVLRLEQIFGDGFNLRLQPAVLGGLVPFALEELAALHQFHGVELPLTTNATSAEGLDSLDRLLELDDGDRRRLVEAVGVDLPVPELLERLERGSTISAVVQTGSAVVRRYLRHVQSGV